MKRTKLSLRKLPDYYKGEEIMNMVTHIVGGAFALAALVLCIIKSAQTGGARDVTGAVIYGVAMVNLYTISSVYHGLRPNMGKKVMQIIDHCSIYFLIVGTYTPILLTAFVPTFPYIGWGLLAAQWTLAILATVLTAIDLRKFRVFSMICYIGMGWGILLFLPETMQLLPGHGFAYLLSGGIAYTIGAILYGIGSKKHWMHSVFHIFVVLGSVLQFICIYWFVY